jgi:uracil phosphoribosyltransferase
MHLFSIISGGLLKKHLNVQLVDNPLAQETLTTLRDRKTDLANFRRGLTLLGKLTGIEITRTMDYVEVEVETPTDAKSRGISLRDARNVVVINVLRAGLPFVEGLVEILPEARIGVVSARRVEEGVAAPEYRFKIEMPYFRVPTIHPEDTLIIADPMLASGSTLLAVLDGLLRVGSPKRVIAASVVSAPLGVERVNARYPTVEVFTAAVDEGLNEHGYIVPGLGDAGDRVCG